MICVTQSETTLRAVESVNKSNLQTTSHFELIQSIGTPKSKWQVITMDFVARLPETKNGCSCIMTVVDRLSKTLRLISIKSTINTPEAAMIFKEYIYRNHGIPT